MLRLAIKLADGHILPLSLQLGAELVERRHKTGELGKPLNLIDREWVWCKLFRDPPVPDFMEVMVDSQDIARLIKRRHGRE
jgi:hypothetical protein